MTASRQTAMLPPITVSFSEQFSETRLLESEAISELLSQSNQGSITGPHRHIFVCGHTRERLWRESVFPWMVMILFSPERERERGNDSLLTLGTIEQKTSVQPGRRGGGPRCRPFLAEVENSMKCAAYAWHSRVHARTPYQSGGAVLHTQEPLPTVLARSEHDAWPAHYPAPFPPPARVEALIVTPLSHHLSTKH